MNKSLRFLLIGNSINVLGDYLLIPIFALFVGKIGGTPQLAGILFATQFIVSALGSLILTRIKDRKSLDNRLLQINFVIKGSGWLLLAFVQTIPILFIVEAAIGVASAIGAPSFFSLVSEHLDKDKHISDWSVWSVFSDLTTGIGSFVSGFIIIAYGFTPLFALMALLEVISLVVCCKVKSPNPVSSNEN